MNYPQHEVEKIIPPSVLVELTWGAPRPQAGPPTPEPEVTGTQPRTQANTSPRPGAAPSSLGTGGPKHTPTPNPETRGAQPPCQTSPPGNPRSSDLDQNSAPPTNRPRRGTHRPPTPTSDGAEGLKFYFFFLLAVDVNFKLI